MENIFWNCSFHSKEDLVQPVVDLGDEPSWGNLPLITSEVLIKDMPVNTRGFAVWWAIVIDEDFVFWLNGHHIAKPQIGGTIQLEVACTSNGYFIDTRRCTIQKAYSPHTRYTDPFPSLPILNVEGFEVVSEEG